MVILVLDKEKTMLAAAKKPAEKSPPEGTAKESQQIDTGKEVTRSRFDPAVRVTEAMRWHSADKPARKKRHNQNSNTGPTWGHLLGQILVGLIEILIPLAFIGGMIYWRAPWLFWAVVHFLRGEPILNF